MKKILLLSGLVLSSSLTLQAQLADGFEQYTAGITLNGDNGGSGPWTSAWTASAGSGTVAAKTLVYSNGSVYSYGGNNVMSQGFSPSTDNTSFQTHRSFTAYDGAATSEFFVSFLINTPNIGAGSDDFLQIWIGSAGASTSSSSQTDKFGFILRNGDIRALSPTQEVSSSTSMANDTTYMVVMRISTDAPNGAANQYDQVDLYLNPTSTLSESTPIATAVTSASVSSLSQLGVRFALYEADTDGAYIDNVMIGDTWNAVVIPEKSTFMLPALALGAAWLIGRRKRKG